LPLVGEMLISRAYLRGDTAKKKELLSDALAEARDLAWKEIAVAIGRNTLKERKNNVPVGAGSR